jgi:hypothetical protein
MDHRTFRILIAVVLIIFVVATLTFQSICAPNKNLVSAAVSTYVDKTYTEPAPQRIDPLSYDGVKKVIVRWVSQYCKR